ncbi:MAG: chloride channel protein [Saprospiraceae bacterium]|nr:chloride channel protein [Saprospiraceae bacterium]
MIKLFKTIKNRLSPKQFEIVVAIIVGLSAGFLAVILKTIVHYIHKCLSINHAVSHFETPYMIFFPLVGILLTVLFVQKVLKGDLGRGVSNILYEIAQKSALVKRHKIFSHIITSSLTVGFGGSAGLEAPIVITGSAVGSNIATQFRLGYRERSLFLGCGAAAGIAAVFNAPIAGVMFAMEVLLSEVTISSFIPLIISAACGGLYSKILNENTLFAFQNQKDFHYTNTPFYILLALVCGIISLYYIRISHTVSLLFKKLPLSIWGKAVVGGVGLALFIYIFPSLFGEGYDSIRSIADGKANVVFQNSMFSDVAKNDGWLIAFIGAIVLIKPVATSFTLSSGGNGGNFAPSLFVGTYLGYVFSHSCNKLFNWQLPETNFAIVGMAGILSGVMYAPLTGIFLIAEVTGGYDLIIPLMIVSTLSHVFVRTFEPYSLEVRSMIDKGEVFSRDKDRNILLLLKTSNLIETDIKTINPTATLRQLTELIKNSQRNIFAVINADNQLEGIITLDDVREVMFQTTLYDTMTVRQLMHEPPAVVRVNESMSEAMKKFDMTEAWNLPVVDEGNVYIGFISKSSVFSKYRTQLMAMNAE